MDRASIIELIKDWALALTITVAVLVGWRMLQPAPVVEGSAPPVVGLDLQGRPWQLVDVEQEVVVLNFWATWCGPCRQEIPELSAFADAHPEIAMVGLSVDTDMTTPMLASRSRQLGIRYPVVHDTDLSTAMAWGVTTYPTTYVLDADRHIVSTHVGTVSRQILEQMVAQAASHRH